jgi:arabinose-5-phosphate isomerase
MLSLLNGLDFRNVAAESSPDPAIPRSRSASITLSSMSITPNHESAADLVRIEAAALEALAQRLDGPMRAAFDEACTLLVDVAQNNQRVILAGVGKSGLIARKIAATLVSTGTPAQFLHPSEALHGDIGILTRGDILLALSYSGETEELLQLLPAIHRIGATLISFCGCATSTLAEASVVSLDVSVSREACSLQLAPTASTTAMLALGDALAIQVSRTLGFEAQHFAERHPGGQLGRRLSSVHQLMHTADALPQVAPTATMPEIIHEMSAKRLGMTTVQAAGKFLGIISDGDLRRLFERDGPNAFHRSATEIMNPTPLTISPVPLAPDALLLMEQRKITALVVTEDGTQNSRVLGVLHIHDLWEVAPPVPQT